MIIFSFYLIIRGKKKGIFREHSHFSCVLHGYNSYSRSAFIFLKKNICLLDCKVQTAKSLSHFFFYVLFSTFPVLRCLVKLSRQFLRVHGMQYQCILLHLCTMCIYISMLHLTLQPSDEVSYPHGQPNPLIKPCSRMRLYWF